MDLSTRYLGLNLRNPLVASASPLSRTADGVRRLADAGVGAVVLYSLFEEQLRREAEHDDRIATQGSESYAESLSYFPAHLDNGGGHRYLRLVERAAAAVDIPVIASLNASTPGSWARYARSMQDAGAAAIELNIYHLPGDPGPKFRTALPWSSAISTCWPRSKPPQRYRSPSSSAPFSARRQTWPTGWTPPVRTGWSCSTGFCSPISTRKH
ncbi:putative dihydroorotate oxidase-1 [Mycobacterium kansasii]|uniref:Putative dihydroorotate oxidase-1 n=1 Tax=Mycobacterium kansasii TaxID=1768 RepID=A0A1V3WZ26_MYCKA|nr:putative dihydroorotate oxidase-1 [Mycobacterium kansasii]